MADITGLYGSTDLSKYKSRPLTAALYSSSPAASSATTGSSSGSSTTDGAIDWDKWVQEQYAAQEADIVKKNQELANAAGIASSGVAVDTSTRALQDLKSDLTNTAMTNKYQQQLQKEAEDAAAANLRTQLGSQASLQEASLAAQAKLQQESLAASAQQAELNRQLEAAQAEENRKSQEKIAEESSPSALSSIASAVGGAGTMYALSQFSNKGNSAKDMLDALREGGYLPKNNVDKGLTTDTVNAPTTPATASSDWGSSLSSGQKFGLGSLATLAGAGLGSLVGGNQNKAWSTGGLVGSGLGGLGGYFAAPTISTALGLGGGLTSGLVGAGLGGLVGNILGRQIRF